MTTLHLPTAHSDADVALAIEVAAVVGSAELYVTWTRAQGPGQLPEVEAVVHEYSPEDDYVRPRGRSRVAEVLILMGQTLAAVWHALLHPPSTRVEQPAPRRRPAAPPRSPETLDR
jgi:hypothetical protein